MDVGKPKFVTMIFKPDGSMELETTGFEGPKACKEASLPFEEALGTKTSEKMTQESYVQPTKLKNTIKHG